MVFRNVDKHTHIQTTHTYIHIHTIYVGVDVVMNAIVAMVAMVTVVAVHMEAIVHPIMMMMANVKCKGLQKYDWGESKSISEQFFQTLL